MNNLKKALLVATLGAALTGCNCGGPPVAEDGGTGGGNATGGGQSTGGGSSTGGGNATGGGGGGGVAMDAGTDAGSTGPTGTVIEFSSAAGRVSSTSLSADVQIGLVPTRLRASGGSLSLEGSAVLLP
jgi:hypothetical protein